MLWSFAFLTLPLLQEGTDPSSQEPMILPHFALRVPDLDAAREALSASAWSRLLADDQFTAGLRELTGDPETTVTSILEKVRWRLKVDAPEVLDLLDLLSTLRSFTVGAIVRSGDLDRPARDWRLAGILQHGEVVAVLEVSDTEAGQRWLEAYARLFGRPPLREAIGDAKAGWNLDGTTLTLRLGAGGSVLPVESLDRALASVDALPDPEGVVLADAYIAPFDAFHLHPRPPEALALSRLLRVLAGPQAWFFLGAGRSRLSVASDGSLVVDDARPILSIESGDLLGRSPVSRDAYVLAHPKAFLALVTSLHGDALRAAMKGLMGEEVASSFVAPLGNALAVSMPPVRGIGQIPPVFLAVRHSDRKAVVDATARACAGVVASLEAFAVVERKEYRGAVMFTLVAEPGAFPPDLEFLEGLLRPTVAVLDDRIVATTAPAAMKKEIRRLHKEDGAHEGLAAVAAPAKASMVGHVDWGQTAAQAASILGGLIRLQSASGGREDGAMGALDLPWSDLVPRHFPPGRRWSTAEGGVLVGHSEVSADLLDAAVLVTTAALADLALADAVGQRLADAQRGVARADIVRLGQEVDAYVLEHLESPASLEALVEGGETPVDPWGRPYAYRVDGSFEYLIWSMGPNGVDENGKGDDVTRRD